jgi:hypothetical protein
LQPITVKATSTRTADSVRIAFFMIIPPSSHYLTICPSDAGRVRTADAHQTTIFGTERRVSGAS